MGGFAKEPEEYPDPFHSYLALAALTMMAPSRLELGLKELDIRWNVSVESAQWLREEMERIRQHS